MLLLVVAIVASPVVLFAALVSIISAIVAIVEVQIIGNRERDPSLVAASGHDALTDDLTQAASFDLACNWTRGCTAKIVLAIFMINALIVPCSLHLSTLRFFACNTNKACIYL